MPESMKTEEVEQFLNVNAPRQRRSEETQRRILKAVAALLAEGRYQDATVQEIVSLSCCSIGAFYGRFKDKNAALYMFYDERCSELEELAEERLRPEEGHAGTLADAVDAFIEVVAEQTMANAPILRAGAMLTPGKASAPFWARAKAMNARFFQWMELLLRERGSEHTHPNPRVASLYAIAIIGGLSRDAILIGARLVAEKGDLETFKSELKRAIYGYLGVRTVKLN